MSSTSRPQTPTAADAAAPARRTFTEGFGFGGASFVASAAVGVISTVVTARIYGVEVVGQYALVYSPTGVLWTLSTAGERMAFIRRVSTVPARSPLLSGLWVAVLSFSAALTLLACLIAAALSYLALEAIGEESLYLPTVVCLLGYFIVSNTSWNLDAVLIAYRSGRQMFWIQLHEALAYLGVAAAMGLVTDSVWGMVVALLASSSTALVHRVWSTHRWMHYRADRPSVREGYRELPELVKYGSKAIPGSIAGGLSSQLGTWILGATASIASVGIWSRCWGLGARLLSANQQFTSSVLPTLVERHESGDRAGVTRALSGSLRYVGMAMLAPGVAIGAASTSVMQLFGPEFERGAAALAIVMVVPALGTMARVQNDALLALGHPWRSSACNIFRLVAAAALMIPLASSHGVTGLAAGFLAAYGLQLLVQQQQLRRVLSGRLNVAGDILYFVRVFVAYGAALAGGLVIDEYVGGVVALVLAAGVGFTIYMLALVALRVLTAEDWARLRALGGGLRA